MKYLKTYEIFGLGKKTEQGDQLAKKVLDIAKKENLKIEIEFGDDTFGSLFDDEDENYYVEIDGKKYHFTENSLIVINNYESSYVCSKKYFKEIKRIYMDQEIVKDIERTKIYTDRFNKDIEELDDTHRTAKKYNL